MIFYSIFYSIRNFILRPFLYFGPTLICFKGPEGLYKDFTVGKVYYSERRDGVSYYVKDDAGVLNEVVKTRFTLIKKIK